MSPVGIWSNFNAGVQAYDEFGRLRFAPYGSGRRCNLGDSRAHHPRGNLTLDRDLGREDALGYWCSPRHQTFVAEEDGSVIGTYYLRANQGGGGGAMWPIAAT